MKPGVKSWVFFVLVNVLAFVLVYFKGFFEYWAYFLMFVCGELLCGFLFWDFGEDKR